MPNTHSLTADQRETIHAFRDLVNMTPKQLKSFLETDASESVGQKKDGGESVGHASGRRIVKLKQTKMKELTDADIQHMNKVVGYIKRHCKQGPRNKADIEDSRWRHSLMNWGHDPLKSSSHCGRSH
jgi:hypothetical protein